MKYMLLSVLPVILLLPVLASAQGLINNNVSKTEGFGGVVAGFDDLITSYLIPVLISLAVLVFIYGVFKYFILGGGDEEAREQGKSLMLYAIIGFAAIVALWGIVYFVVNAFGFDPADGDELRDGPSGAEVGGA